MHVSWKQKFLQKLRSAHLSALFQWNKLRHITDNIDYLFVIVINRQLLIVIPENDRISDHNFSGIHRFESEDHFEKSRFSGSVIPYHSESFLTLEHIGEILQNNLRRVGLTDVVHFHYFGSKSFHFHRNIQFIPVNLLFCYFLRIVKSIDSCFLFCSPCLGLPSHPLQFVAKLIFCLLNR